MFEFDSATAVSRRPSDGSSDQPGHAVFDGEIHDGWDIGGNANGGYLLAVAGAAMGEASGRPDPITLTAHYLAPGRPGPVTIETDIVKSGRQLATMTASLRSGDREVMRLLGSFGDVAASSGGFRDIVGAPPELPPLEECTARSDNGVVGVPLMGRMKVRLNPAHVRFNEGIRTGRAVIEGWFEFADDRPVDTLALLFVVDAFPPPVFNIDMPLGWVPTVELTVHVRGIPVPGPLRCRFHTEYIQNGFLQEDSEVWDASDRLVATSRQLALVPRG